MTTDHPLSTEASTPHHKAKPRHITVSAVALPSDQPAPVNALSLLANALLLLACPELDAAQAIVQHERQRRSQRHIHDAEIDRLRRQVAEAEARRAG